MDWFIPPKRAREQARHLDTEPRRGKYFKNRNVKKKPSGQCFFLVLTVLNLHSSRRWKTTECFKVQREALSLQLQLLRVKRDVKVATKRSSEKDWKPSTKKNSLSCSASVKCEWNCEVIWKISYSICDKDSERKHIESIWKKKSLKKIFVWIQKSLIKGRI